MPFIDIYKVYLKTGIMQEMATIEFPDLVITWQLLILKRLHQLRYIPINLGLLSLISCLRRTHGNANNAANNNNNNTSHNSNTKTITNLQSPVDFMCVMSATYFQSK